MPKVRYTMVTQETITYFDSPGPENTPRVFALVDAALDQYGLDTVVVASTCGDTARYALDHYQDRSVHLVLVPHQYGFGSTGEQRFPQSLIERAIHDGHQVCFGTMLFHQDKLWGRGTPQVVADFLRFFGQGVKVCIEILLMAANAGCVRAGQEVVVMAGTGRGADTALIMTTGTSMAPKDLHISRILCKPL